MPSSACKKKNPVSLTNFKRSDALKWHGDRLAAGRDEKVWHVEIVGIFRGRFAGINVACCDALYYLRVPLFFFNDTATTVIYTLSLQRRSSDLSFLQPRC